jgi:hypothetical protein
MQKFVVKCWIHLLVVYVSAFVLCRAYCPLQIVNLNGDGDYVEHYRLCSYVDDVDVLNGVSCDYENGDVVYGDYDGSIGVDSEAD